MTNEKCLMTVEMSYEVITTLRFLFWTVSSINLSLRQSEDSFWVFI